MTPAEIETMLEHLHVRTNRIEQSLPTLATKQDLADGLNAVGARFDALARQMLVLHEDLKSDVRLLAEHLARVLERLDGR